MKQLALLLASYFFFTLVSAQDRYFFQLSDAAIGLTKNKVTYDPAYRNIPYPNGDVPSNTGVCTDVVIRAYRKLGVDLQKEVHEDISMNKKLYPASWGLQQPDANIDHRRVPNLMVFFSRFGKVKPISMNIHDFAPGDIVCWRLGPQATHIGIVVNRRSSDGLRYLVVHNIGRGQEVDDCLYNFKMIGHYSYKK
jgi:uncharacterized protein YijF (DUF1287 family)